MLERKKIFYLDPIEILLDERSKRICNKWNQTGSCPFGDNCKYSHRSNYELIQLIEQQSILFSTEFCKIGFIFWTKFRSE